MTASGTYTFDPQIGDLTLAALSRIGITRAAILQEHLVNARLEANLLLQAWSNRGVNLWEVDLQTQALIAGTATYTLAESTVAVLDVYLQIGSATTADRILYPISRSDYAAYPDKTTGGVPTVFWFNRQQVPTLTVWSPPDSASSYALKYYRMRTAQDANLAGGETLDLPDRFSDAFVAGLAHRLARHHARELEQQRRQDAIDAWAEAAGADTETASIFILPQMGGYYR